MLVVEHLCGFQHIGTTNDALLKDVANMSRSSFINKIEEMELP